VSRPLSNLRLFVAAYPPPDAAAALLNALRNLPIPAHRATSPDQVHLTVQFIGDVPAAKLDETIESVERSVAGLRSFSLQPTRLLTLPSEKPARLIAAECTAHPTLLEIHRRLAHRFADSLRHDPADRFIPHLTLCRFGAAQTGLSLNQPLQVPPMLIQHIDLMRSVLSLTGAQHKLVISCRLEP
jgi:RNA 2',3'-cyclic 3'-phosphodiesterase